MLAQMRGQGHRARGPAGQELSGLRVWVLGEPGDPRQTRGEWRRNAHHERGVDADDGEAAPDADDGEAVGRGVAAPGEQHAARAVAHL